MTFWQDQTIRVDDGGTVEIAPDGTVHVTWHEPGVDGVSLTIILSQAEAEHLIDQFRQGQTAEQASA